MKYGKEFYQTYGRFSGDTQSHEILRLAKNCIKGNVLDVGSGSGKMIECLKKKHMNTVYGIDINSTRPDILEAGIDDIPFKTEWFDTIVCSEVLEHLDDETLTKGIQEIYRVLKPGGYVIITTPYKDELKNNVVKCPCCNTEFHRWGHVQSFDTIDLQILLSIKPFAIRKMEVLPLGFMATHKILRYFIPIIKNMPLVRYEQRSIFMITQKV